MVKSAAQERYLTSDRSKERALAQLLWQPSAERIKNANMTRFMQFVNRRYNKRYTDYFDLYDWSINYLSDFWSSVWDFVEIKASRQYEKAVTDLNKFPGTEWFPGAKLNFAENLLRFRDDQAAFVFKSETRPSVSITYAELYKSVARLTGALRKQEVTRKRPRCSVYAEHDRNGRRYACRDQYRSCLGSLRIRAAGTGGD